MTTSASEDTGKFVEVSGSRASMFMVRQFTCAISVGLRVWDLAGWRMFVRVG